MSRTMHDTTEVYRVVKSSGWGKASHYGPYDSKRAANWVKSFEHQDGYDMKVQKLVAQCSDEETPDGELEHEAWLMWVDV